MQVDNNLAGGETLKYIDHQLISSINQVSLPQSFIHSLHFPFPTTGIWFMAQQPMQAGGQHQHHHHHDHQCNEHNLLGKQLNRCRGPKRREKRAAITNDFSPIGAQSGVKCAMHTPAHISRALIFWGSVDYDLLIVESWICR